MLTKIHVTSSCLSNLVEKLVFNKSHYLPISFLLYITLKMSVIQFHIKLYIKGQTAQNIQHMFHDLNNIYLASFLSFHYLHLY